jgi:hypothetical protein
MEEVILMARSRRNEDSDRTQNARPALDDPVLTALRQTEAQYSKTYQGLQHQRVEAERELALAHEENERLTQKVSAQRLELDQERRQAQHQRENADALAAALKDIHRALFTGNVYDLILKTCLTLTGATRGLYVTTGGQHEPLRARAAVEVDEYPSSRPSPFITALCRTVLQTESVSMCNDLGSLHEQPGDGESFRNCVVAPVVLRANLSGVVIVADKAGGDFDDDDAQVLLSVGSQAAVAIENARLQREVQETYLSIVALLAEAMAARNVEVQRHQESAWDYARPVADRLGLSQYERSTVYYAALLHDIGKIGVSDGVLNKPGPLLEAERELIRAHVQIGHDLLRNLPLLEPVAEVVRHHHERYDGTGYPDGLKGDAIPVAARVVAVVDAYRAMRAPRSYRLALSKEQACRELRRGAGTQFDPHVVEIFLASLDLPEVQRLDTEGESSDVALPALEVTRGAAHSA